GSPKIAFPLRNADILCKTRSTSRSIRSARDARNDARRRKPAFPFSSPWAASRMRSPIPHLSSTLRLVERPLGPRQGFWVAQHFEAHRTGKWEDFNKLDLDLISELISLACPASEERPCGFVEMVVVVT